MGIKIGMPGVCFSCDKRKHLAVIRDNYGICRDCETTIKSSIENLDLRMCNSCQREKSALTFKLNSKNELICWTCSPDGECFFCHQEKPLPYMSGDSDQGYIFYCKDCHYEEIEIPGEVKDMQTIIETTTKELKITADYESVTITKRNFYQFSFTKFDDLVWAKAVPDLTGKVLFQIMFNKKNSTAGTFILDMDEANVVGKWLVEATGLNRIKTDEIDKKLKEMGKNFPRRNKKKSNESGFDFPEHYHRMMKSSMKLSKELKAEWDKLAEEEKILGEGYRRALSGDWSVVVPINEETTTEFLNRFDRKALPIEKITSIVLKVERNQSPQGTV